MKTFRLIAATFVFAAVFAVSAFAQAPAAQPAAGRIGLIRTSDFGGDDKGVGGITKMKNAIKSLSDEFKPVDDKLKTMRTKYQTSVQEFEKMRNAGPNVPVGGNLEAKAEEIKNLETQIKREEEDGKGKYERRYQQVMGPVYDDLRKAMNDFAKQKGYSVILDGAILEQSNLLWGYDDKYDITKEFIAFYNQRPAGAATATTAKP